MKDELKLLGFFISMFILMAVAYPGSSEEQVTRYASMVEAEEPVHSEYPEPVVELEPYKVDLLSYSFIDKAEEPELVSMGTFKVTAYCSCKECCGRWAERREDGVVRGASGQQLVAGYSISVDPSVIPYGSEVYLNGQKYVAQDCGVEGNSIDLYMSSHEEAQEWGVQYLEVFKAVVK